MEQIDETLVQQLQTSIDNCIHQNAKHLKASEAALLIQAIQTFAKEETVELLDRIIGNDVYELGPQQVVESLKAFLNTQKSRPKIQLLLLKRIKDNVKEYTVSELCEVSMILRTYGGAHEGMYNLIEPYILNKIPSLTENDLVMALVGFYNPELSRRFDLLDQLESIVVDQIDSLSQDTVEVLLNFFS